MPVASYYSQKEPGRERGYLALHNLRTFRDLIASEELRFRHADLFDDEREGLPLGQYVRRVLGLDPWDIHERMKLNNHLGSLSQCREMHCITCRYLFDQETLKMWGRLLSGTSTMVSRSYTHTPSIQQQGTGSATNSGKQQHDNQPKANGCDSQCRDRSRLVGTLLREPSSARAIPVGKQGSVVARQNNEEWTRENCKRPVARAHLTYSCSFASLLYQETALSVVTSKGGAFRLQRKF